MLCAKPLSVICRRLEDQTKFELSPRTLLYGEIVREFRQGELTSVQAVLGRVGWFHFLKIYEFCSRDPKHHIWHLKRSGNNLSSHIKNSFNLFSILGDNQRKTSETQSHCGCVYLTFKAEAIRLGRLNLDPIYILRKSFKCVNPLMPNRYNCTFAMFQLALVC